VELAAEGGGDGLAEAGLAHARRPHEAEDGPLDVRLHLEHGQVFEDAVLHLLEVVVVGVQDLLGLLEVDLFRGLLAPGQRHQPVEVGPRHGVLGGGGRHAGEPVQLPHRLLLGVLRHARGVDLLLELAELPLLVVAVPELLLDGLHLLAEVVLALVLLELGLDLALDLVADLEHLEVLGEDPVDPLEPGADVDDLEKLLLLGRVQGAEAARDEVGQTARVLDVGGQRLQLVGQRRGELDDLLEQAERALGQRLDLDLLVGRNRLVNELDAREKERLVLADAAQAEALHALDDQAQGAVRELEHLVDVRERADAMQIALHRIVHGRVPLRDDADDLPLAHRVVDEGNGALTRHGQGQDGVGKEDGVAERKDPELSGEIVEVDVVDAIGLEVRGPVVPASAHLGPSASAADVRELAGQARLRDARFALRFLSVLEPLLAVAASLRERQGLEPVLGDECCAILADAVGALGQPPDRLVDLGEGARLHLHQREVDLLDEVRHHLLFGVLDLARLRGKGLADAAQLLLDLAAPVLQHRLEDLVTLAVPHALLG
jgi:hypothetical protein